MTYSWDIYHLLNETAKGKKTAEDLKSRLLEEQRMYPESAFRMQFTSNHDENSWNGTVFERLGNAAESFSVFISLIPGMALIYNGQEAGLDKRLKFFEKDPINWKEHEFKGIYTMLFNLKKSNSALWNGERGGEMKIIPSEDKNIFAFIRINGADSVVAVFNMSDKSADINIESSVLTGNYTDLFENRKVSFSSGFLKKMSPWEYKVYIN
jgi:glycosidase